MLKKFKLKAENHIIYCIEFAFVLENKLHMEHYNTYGHNEDKTFKAVSRVYEGMNTAEQNSLNDAFEKIFHPHPVQDSHD